LIDLNTNNKQVKITRTITSMIDKKKVVMEGGIKTTTNIINHKNIEIETTIHKSNYPSTIQSELKKAPVRGSYVGGSSMLSIMKTSAPGASGLVTGQAA
jgi:hypothetical protein